MQDEDRAVELFVNGLGQAYVSIKLGGKTLHSVIEEAQQLERRYTINGFFLPDRYASSSGM